MVDLKLNPLLPDFDQIYTQMQAHLLNEQHTTTIWSDILTAATGDFILRMISAMGAENQFAIERAQHEVQLEIARRPSSVYLITRMLGAHIQRKTPASAPVVLQRSANTSNTLIIPAYSRWSVNGSEFFNRSPIYFAPNQLETNANLFRGQFTSESYISTGAPWQEFTLGPPNFVVSDVDLFAMIGTPAENWSKITTGLWQQHSTSKVFYENTKNDGRVFVRFGNGIYGAVPVAGETITFYYVIIDDVGSIAEQINQLQTNAEAVYLDNPDVVGFTTAPSTLDSQPRDVGFYQIMAPYMRSKDKVCSNRNDYRAAALEYPGVIDAVIQGQAEINPSDLRWMNTAKITILTDPVFSSGEWNAFLNFIHTKGSFLHIERNDPEKVSVDVELDIFCNLRADLTSVKNLATAVIEDIFKPKFQSLGRLYSENNLTVALQAAIRDPHGGLIDHVRTKLPTRDIQLSKTQYAALGKLTITTQYSTREFTRVVRGITVPS